MSLLENSNGPETITWNGMRVEKEKLQEFFRSSNKISWYISDKCNFDCFYCGDGHMGLQSRNAIDMAKLSESLDRLGKDWVFYITGGEPFLEKNYVEICEEITKKHFLSFSSNLTTQNVYDFADRINPGRCLFINASIHPTEREKKDKNFKLFIEKILYLQKKGFNIVAVYVSHPTLFERIKSDFETLRANGVEKANVKLFRGWYNGKPYPESLNAKQMEFLETMEADYPEFEIMHEPPRFHGNLCIAGQKSFAMDRNGKLVRCSSALKKYGNFFDGTMKTDTKPRPCPKSKYACPHECVEFNLDTKGAHFAMINEDINETWLRLLKGDVISGAILAGKFWQMIGAFEKAGIPLDKVKKAFTKSR